MENSELNSELVNQTKLRDSKDMTSFYSEKSAFQGSEQEKAKRRTAKKILLMSTIEKSIMKILLRVLQEGSKAYDLDIKDKLVTAAKKLIDREKQKELEDLIEGLFPILAKKGMETVSGMNEPKKIVFPITNVFLKIIKYFVQSPVEKQYIAKIEEEIEESDRLDNEIIKAQNRIKDEKDKKLLKYTEEKYGKTKSGKEKESCEALLREISVHENKLEKANQKLNEIVANNNNLREKINQLRKEKNVIEDIYTKLKDELEKKKETVENTIKSAGEAYISRNKAEVDLAELQQKAKLQKEEFEKEYKELNENIQKDKRFKQFIKGKQKEKEILANLEKAIKKNEEIIREKKASNLAIDNEYSLSSQKEKEIKEAFKKIKKETGIKESKEKESKELLNVFVTLYQKNMVMSKFVKELSEEVEDLEKKIEEKKKEIQIYSTKGATSDNQRRELKIALTNKIQQEEKKKSILKAQYEKSIETINMIKGYLENVFSAIDVEPEIIEKLKNSAITEENMVFFLGILEQKGIDAISEYARLIAEQLKLEKGDVGNIAQQIEDLNNIIQYENANIMNFYSTPAQIKPECPEDLLAKEEDHEEPTAASEKNNKFLNLEELRKMALETLNKKFINSNNNKIVNSGVKQKPSTGTKAAASSLKSPKKGS